jgi:hypothetical protein
MSESICSNRPDACFNCGKAPYVERVKDYLVQLPAVEQGVNWLTIPDVLFLCCDECGDETLPPEGWKKADAAIAEWQGRKE